jgi:hypothetical protein
MVFKTLDLLGPVLGGGGKDVALMDLAGAGAGESHIGE